MVGSVDYNSKDPKVAGAVNIVTSVNRSMGSATKPLVYATAFQMGWNPGIMLQDQPICFPNGMLVLIQPPTSHSTTPMRWPATDGTPRGITRLTLMGARSRCAGSSTIR